MVTRSVDLLVSPVGNSDAARPATRDPDGIREEIVASWSRSESAGLRPEKFDVLHRDDVDRDAFVTRASMPVLSQLAEDVASLNVGIVLADDEAQVIARFVGQRSLNRTFDEICLVPGFIYGEDVIGTNAIGTALVQGSPSFVTGREHFADAVARMSCAAAPITDRSTGHVLGVVDLTCRSTESSPLMLPMAQSAARQIEERVHRLTPGLAVRGRILSDTERLVSELVAEGLTNRAIAGRLLMSPYTVDSHLRSMFRKLSISSRVELARIVSSSANGLW